MAVKIRLKRMGKIRAPHYRVVVMNSRTKRDGRAIEEIGTYNPMAEPSLIDINSERAQYWLGVGAQPTEQAMALLKVTGDWQKFKSEPGAEGTLRPPRAQDDKKALYEAAVKQAGGSDLAQDTATTSKRAAKSSTKSGTKSETPEKSEEAAPAETPEKSEEAAPAEKAETPASDAPAADAGSEAGKGNDATSEA